MSSDLQEQLQIALGDIYLLERELGGGGMSRVFVAHERALGRKVVVKVLLPELAAAVSVERFRREILLAAQLQHPHIVPLLSAGEADGLPYFIMPYVAGESLRARITREGEFPIADTVHILRDVVSALAYAHAHGVIHRDVKPDNVLLSHGVAVVTDFGVAKALSASSGASEGSGITSAGVALGTPAYMAPEQATASPLTDHRADIYALGAMAYELLTGLPPFAGRTAQAVLAAHVIEEPEPVERRRPAVPPMLATLVRECLCKRPADRPQSAAEVMHALDAIVTPSGGTAATSAVRLPVANLRGNPRLKWLAGAGVALALLTGGVLWFQRQPPTVESRAAAATSSSPTSVTAVGPDSVSPQAAPPTRPPPAEIERSSEEPGWRRAAVPTPPAPPPVKESEKAPAPPIVQKPAREDSSPVDTAGLTREQPVAPAPAAAADTSPSPPPTPAPSVAPAPTPQPPPVPADHGPAIRAAVAEYGAAIEARNIERIRRVYPGMTEAQQRGWEQFFELTRDVQAELTLPQLRVSGSTAEGVVAGSYTYLNTSNGRVTTQPVSFKVTFRADNGKWRLVAVR